MKSAIVTGANGFVGSALVRELVNQNVQVIAVVRNQESDISRIKDLRNVKVIYCDMEQIEKLKLSVSEEVEVFYHFAWTGSAGSLRTDIHIQLNNIQYTCDAVETAAALGCSRFVLASSIMETECKDIMDTDMSPGMGYIYATGKLAGNYMARCKAGSLNLDFIAGIISNIYGVGELSPRLINTSIQKLQNGERASFSPGEQIYDFIYVTDAAKAFYAIGIRGKANRSYYIGSQNPRKLKIFLEEMRAVVASDAVMGIGDFEFNGVSLDYRKIDIQLLNQDTDFVPEVSFQEGIKITADWLKQIKQQEDMEGCNVTEI